MQEDYIMLNNKVGVREKGEPFNFKNLEYDKLAVKDYFISYVNKHTRFFHSLEEKLDYLVKNDYWIDFIEEYGYSLEFIKGLFKKIYAKEFRFQSYMAAKKFYDSYALRDDDGETILERYEDRICCVALYLARGDRGLASNLAHMMIDQIYQPATPTFLNAGRARGGELVSCYLDEIGDSMESIGYAVSSSLKLSSLGGGVAMNLTNLRAAGAPIKGVEGRGSGVTPVAKILDDVFSYANQLGQREGAGVVYLNIFHSDIEDFLDTKKINADEKLRLKTLSIGITVPKKFIELAKLGESFYTFDPYDIQEYYHKSLDDIDWSKEYDNLLADSRLRKTKSSISALNFLGKIAKVQKESGYPYLVFTDNANEAHANKNRGRIHFSNLCTEIMQVSEPSEINDYNTENKYNSGISCVLGSLNLATLMEKAETLPAIVDNAIQALSNVSDIMRGAGDKLPPSIFKANKESRAIGLGAMNLQGMLAKLGLRYDSKEARELVDWIFNSINFYSLKSSMELAKFKNSKYDYFEGSEYHTGKYFYNLRRPNSFKSTRVAKILRELKLPIPTDSDWAELRIGIMKYGLYNAYRLAIAPNQSTAYIMNSTPSVVPIVSQIETRVYGDSTTFYPMPYLSEDNILIYKNAYEIDQIEYMKMIATIQKHVDQGISMPIFINSKTTPTEIVKYYLAAEKLGIKAIYYARTKKSYIDSANDLDCLACSV